MDETAIAETRRYGLIICIASAALGLIYALGLLRKSYWALALPLTAATVGALSVSLWIGRALLETTFEPLDDEPPGA